MSGKIATLKQAGISQRAALRDEQLTDILSEAEVEAICADAIRNGEPARIRNRAVERAGDLLLEIKAPRGGDRKSAKSKVRRGTFDRNRAAADNLLTVHERFGESVQQLDTLPRRGRRALHGSKYIDPPPVSRSRVRAQAVYPWLTPRPQHCL